MAITAACTGCWEKQRSSKPQRKRKAGGRRVVASNDGEDRNIHAIEAFRSLRTSILLSTADRPLYLARQQHGNRRGQDTIVQQSCHCSRTSRSKSLLVDADCDLLRCTDYSECKRTWVSSVPRCHQTGIPLCVPGIAWPRSPVLRNLYLQIRRTSLFPKHGKALIDPRGKNTSS